MKYASNERGMTTVLAAIVVVLIIVAAGFAAYSWNKSKTGDSQTAKNSSSPSTSPSSTATSTPAPTPSDQSLITAAVKANLSSSGQTPASGTTLTLAKLEGNYAMVNVTGAQAGNSFELLKKSGDSWDVAFEGQNISPTQEQNLGFPTGFTSTGTFSTAVLYTY